MTRAFSRDGSLAPSHGGNELATTDGTALVAGLVTVSLWGSSFVAIRHLGQSLSPGSIALGRLVVSTTILSAVAVVRRERLPRGRDLLAIVVYGVLFLGVYSVTLNAAERRVDAGTAAMLINTGPILIAVFAGLFLHEGFPSGLFVGSAVAFAGCALISVAATGSGNRGPLGILLCVIAAFAYATAVVVQKPVLARVSSFQVIWLGSAAATIACLPFAPALLDEATQARGEVLAWTGYLGAVPTALGFATWTYALRRTSAGRTASINFLIPVVAIMLGWMLLGETPRPLALIGGGFCLAGVYLVRRRRPAIRQRGR